MAKQAPHSATRKSIQALSALLDKAHHLSSRQPEESYALGKEALQQSEQLLAAYLSPQQRLTVGKENITARLVLAQYEQQRGSLQKVLEDIRRITDAAAELGDAETIGKCYMFWGGALLQSGDDVQSLEMQQRAYECFVKAGRRDAAAQTQYNMALCFYRKGNIASAFSTYQEALATAREFAYHHLEMSILIGLGTLYDQLSEYDSALTHFREARDLARNHGITTSEAQALSNIATALFHGKYFEQAQETMVEALAAYRAMGHVYGEASVLGNMAGYYFETGDYTSALGYYNEALHSFESLKAKADCVRILANMGQTWAARKNLTKSNSCYTKALKIARSLQEPRMTVLTLTGMIANATASGDLQQAEEYYIQAAELNTRIESRIFTEQLLHHGAELYEKLGDYKRSLQLQKELYAFFEQSYHENSARRLALYGTQLQVERARHEREVATLHARDLQNKLETKERELNTMALHLVEKQELIASLKHSIGELEQQSSKEIPTAVATVLRTLEREAEASNREWNTFREQFEHISHDFIARLAAQHPTLTTTELKVCALLRLQLSSKDIAHILHITDRAIEKHRLNIRRKLKLSKNDSLSSLLAGM